MKRGNRWFGWSAQARTRTRAMLLVIVLASLGGVTNRYVPTSTAAPVKPATITIPIVPPRLDSIVPVARTERARQPRASVRLNRYRRSAQVEAALLELRTRDLLLPLPFLEPNDLRDTFENMRGGGSRRHYAIDLAAPKGTPILAVEDGQVLDLKTGGDGGIALFASDASGRFIYYYAHLLKYHPRIEKGLALLRGDTIGYVGTSGNAPESMPHLHFAILLSSSLARWSTGTPINPAEVWRK